MAFIQMVNIYKKIIRETRQMILLDDRIWEKPKTFRTLFISNLLHFFKY